MRNLISWAFWRHMARLQLGLFLFGVAVALMLEAHIGLDPWSSLHEALSIRSGLSFGRVSQGVGLFLIVTSALALSVRPGVATVFNMLVIGPWIDLLREQAWFPTVPGGGVGTIQFLCGILVMGLATAIYIGARLGAGPRDGLAMGLARRIGRSLRLTRNSIEVSVLVLAFLLGGSIGLGTLIFAALMGPTMQASLRLFHVSRDPSPSFSRAQTAPGASPPEEDGRRPAPTSGPTASSPYRPTHRPASGAGTQGRTSPPTGRGP